MTTGPDEIFDSVAAKGVLVIAGISHKDARLTKAQQKVMRSASDADVNVWLLEWLERTVDGDCRTKPTLDHDGSLCGSDMW